jgi:hypothetical protein
MKQQKAMCMGNPLKDFVMLVFYGFNADKPIAAELHSRLPETPLRKGLLNG